MHNVWVRLNAITFYALSVLLGLSVLAAISKIGHSSRNAPVVTKLELNTLRSLKAHGGVDRALLSFDLHADLRPAFHWNTKQIFLTVVATYETKRNPVNQVVLWDKIVEAVDGPENMVFTKDNIYCKYALIDQRGGGLRGKDVTLSLVWDHMPLTGSIHMDKSVYNSTFTLPESYAVKRQ